MMASQDAKILLLKCTEADNILEQIFIYFNTAAIQTGGDPSSGPGQKSDPVLE